MRSCFGKILCHVCKPGTHFLKKSTLKPRFAFKHRLITLLKNINASIVNENFCVKLKLVSRLDALCTVFRIGFYLQALDRIRNHGISAETQGIKELKDELSSLKRLLLNRYENRPTMNSQFGVVGLLLYLCCSSDIQQEAGCQTGNQ